MNTYIVTYPKSGTTWTQNIVACLLNKQFNHINEVIPTMDSLSVITKGDIIKTHLRCSLLPKDSKKIYVMRNPVDVFFSFHNHSNILKPISEENFLKDFLRKSTPSSYNWKDHVEDSLKFKDNLFLSYESLHTNFEDSLNKLATFFNVEVSSNIKETCSFNQMKLESDKFKPRGFKDSKDFFKKGTVGKYDEDFFKGKYSELKPWYDTYSTFSKEIT